MSSKTWKAYGGDFDSRFPNQNQNRTCFQNYVDFNRCIKIKGADYIKPCRYFRKLAVAACTKEQVEDWDGMIQAGNFPGKF